MAAPAPPVGVEVFKLEVPENSDVRVQRWHFWAALAKIRFFVNGYFNAMKGDFPPPPLKVLWAGFVTGLSARFPFKL